MSLGIDSEAENDLDYHVSLVGDASLVLSALSESWCWKQSPYPDNIYWL